MFEIFRGKASEGFSSSVGTMFESSNGSGSIELRIATVLRERTENRSALKKVDTASYFRVYFIGSVVGMNIVFIDRSKHLQNLLTGNDSEEPTP